MKKIIALLLSVIMIFSMTSTAHVVAITTEEKTSNVSIDTYMDYLESKLNDSNLFVRFIAQFMIIGIKLKLIDEDDLKGWFDIKSPDVNDDNNDINDNPDVSLDNDFVDGEEVKLYDKQSFPFVMNGITITNITITKEDYNDINEQNGYYNPYKYLVKIEGYASEPECLAVVLNYGSDIYNSYLIKPEQLDEFGNFSVKAEQFGLYEDVDLYYICSVHYVYD
ncbi:MAG: hypothetical protein II237_01705 [Clostridia bacterium]|nr:hypothetical protein [Clostridia bacterium]